MRHSNQDRLLSSWPKARPSPGSHVIGVHADARQVEVISEDTNPPMPHGNQRFRIVGDLCLSYHKRKEII